MLVFTPRVDEVQKQSKGGLEPRADLGVCASAVLGG